MKSDQTSKAGFNWSPNQQSSNHRSNHKNKKKSIGRNGNNRKKQQKFVWGNQLKIPKSGGNLADESAIGIVDIYIPGYNDGYPSLAPVGSFKKEDSGLYDLSGNVSEWINDFYLLYPPNADILYYDPSGPKEGSSHVVKGSNFRSGSLTEIRASYRDSEVNTQDYIGFRIVRYVYGKQYENNIE